MDGRPLEVFTIKGHTLNELKGTADVTVWIDPKTEWPVRQRIELRTGDVRTTAIATFLGFNEVLDPKQIDLTAPEGYTVTDVKAAEKK